MVCGLSTLLINTHLVLSEGFVLAIRLRVEHWWVCGVLVFGWLVRVRVEHCLVFGVLVFGLLSDGVVLALLTADSNPTMP
jgi:hypothetical protein